MESWIERLSTRDRNICSPLTNICNFYYRIFEFTLDANNADQVVSNLLKLLMQCVGVLSARTFEWSLKLGMGMID